MLKPLFKRRKVRRSRLLLAVAVAAAVPSVASAQTWTAAFGNWDTPGNWFPPEEPTTVTGAAIENGGTAQVSTTDPVAQAILVNAGSSCQVIDGGVLTIGGGGEIIGLSSTGNFNQTGGLNIVGNGFGMSIGNSAGSNGTYTLSGDGTLSVGGVAGNTLQFSESVGMNGTGTFNQSGGLNTMPGSLLIGVSLAIPGATGTYNLSGGSLTAASVQLGSSALAASTGTLTVSSSGLLSISGTVTVHSGSRVNINGGSASVGGLSISTNGTVNVNDSLAINFGSPTNDPVGTIVGYLQSGYNGGTWSGTTGIVSTTAAASSTPLLSVGYVDGNTDTGTPAMANQILIVLTLAGDTNLDGTVNFDDLDIVGQHLNTSGNDWASGNFTYNPNGAVTFNDLDIVGQNLNMSINDAAELDGGTTLALSATAQVQNTSVAPEPTLMGVGILGGALLARRKRRGK
jgi:fibronectin-binding autotransporter adhesin